MVSFNFPEFLAHLSTEPGVYKMQNQAGEVIYVGKARNLKKRVGSYFHKTLSDPKTRALMESVEKIEVIVTQSETEALLIEAELIKSLHPKFNVYFRDDKSYPYLFLSTDEKFPRLIYYRGNQEQKGRYFGPYPSAQAVRETLCELQKVFKLRTCDNTFFKSRTRPCLQYQIKRCSAPCVGYIEATDYCADVRRTILFLEGKDSEVMDELVKKMEEASQKLDFEQAAEYRNRIYRLRKILERQFVVGKDMNSDVVAIKQQNGLVCVQLLLIRHGKLTESLGFFPNTVTPENLEGVLGAFLEQHYLLESLPPYPDEIILNGSYEDKTIFEGALAHKAKKNIPVVTQARGEKAKWVDMAEKNAFASLHQRLCDDALTLSRLRALEKSFGFETEFHSIECFDVSHLQGAQTVASCVVFKDGKADRRQYRRYNIEGVQKGDDYAALRQVLMRRYIKVKTEKYDELPDLIMIDGGKGQLTQAEEVLRELQIGGVQLMAVAKGVSRKPGEETLFMSGKTKPLELPPHSPALHIIQQIRDEAHRFAISGHRKKRSKASIHSILEEIEGIGPKRRKLLLQAFGGLQGLRQASFNAIAKIPGINKKLAEKIYRALRG